MTESDKKLNDGGPAFPVHANTTGGSGLIKREYAAIAAMQGLGGFYGTQSELAIVKTAVSMADALLAELKKEGGE